MTRNPGQPGTPGQAILIMRIIGGSMALGVTLFAFVAWFMHLQDGLTTDFDPGLAFNGFLVLVLLTGVGAVFIWRARVAPIIERPREETEWRARASAIQTGLIIIWALVEGAALVGEVVYFLTGYTLAGVVGVLLIWGAVGLTWPKAEWL